MKIRNLLASAAVAVALVLAGSNAQAQDALTCQPGIGLAFGGPHGTQYQALVAAFVPFAGDLITGLATLTETTYPTLLAAANTAAASIANGRVLLTLPDGTVVIDTNRTDGDPMVPTSNTYAHFLAKTINENHNSRLAIFAAQEYACGAAVESKLSTTSGAYEHYFAFRAGTQLDSFGTIRMSMTE